MLYYIIDCKNNKISESQRCEGYLCYEHKYFEDAARAIKIYVNDNCQQIHAWRNIPKKSKVIPVIRKEIC